MADSGPSQLSLAIMLEVTNDDRKALSLYYDFKYDVIAGLADEEWTLPLKQIERWIAAQQEEDALDDIPYTERPDAMDYRFNPIDTCPRCDEPTEVPNCRISKARRCAMRVSTTLSMRN